MTQLFSTSNSSTTSTEQNSLNSQAIGVFDSGIGGISIARCIAKQLPNERLIYVADSLYAPYGEKSPEEIEVRVNQVADALIKQQVKAIVVACNTATVNAIEQLRQRVDIPIIGVEPAIKPAVLHSKNQRVGILVTSATANNQRFLDLVATHKQQAEVFIQPCPGLVQLIEQGSQESAQCSQLLQEYLTPLLAQGIDTLVLGCTHYPLIAQQISALIDNSITLLETAEPVTKELVRRLSEQQLLSVTSRQASHLVLSSKIDKKQQSIIQHFWAEPFVYQSLDH
ncbi:glutamate racemase [Colwellia sp. MEBiC06753]